MSDILSDISLAGQGAAEAVFAGGQQNRTMPQAAVGASPASGTDGLEFYFAGGYSF